MSKLSQQVKFVARRLQESKVSQDYGALSSMELTQFTRILDKAADELERLQDGSVKEGGASYHPQPSRGKDTRL